MAIKIKLEGFDELLKEIERAGGDIDKACDSAIRGSAQIMQNELKAQMQNAGVDSHLIGAMPAPEIKKTGNRFIARVGYKKGAYNPDNLSDGYKVVFLNYGTPNRKLHGQVKARGFIQRAKKSAKPKIKAEQKKALQKILARLMK